MISNNGCKPNRMIIPRKKTKKVITCQMTAFMILLTIKVESFTGNVKVKNPLSVKKLL